jgi:sodium transport system permease protein
MLTNALIIAHKEVLDGIRDIRSIVSSLFYALMGPSVVLLVSVAIHGGGPESAQRKVLVAMASIFTLVSAFAGGMNIAMDSIAGERERRSLLPLLLNPIRRSDIIAGKWLAVTLFSLAALVLNLAGFAVVFGIASVSITTLLFAAVPLAALAAALQMLISTACRNVKEAQTYLSMSAFLPMAAGMFLVFFSGPVSRLLAFLPIGGHQIQIESLLAGNAVRLDGAAALACFTLALSAFLLRVAASRLESDAIIYGS